MLPFENHNIYEDRHLNFTIHTIFHVRYTLYILFLEYCMRLSLAQREKSKAKPIVQYYRLAKIKGSGFLRFFADFSNL